MLTLRPVVITALLCVLGPSAHAAAAPAELPDCSTEAAALVRDEAELPRLEIVSPADRPVVCITLETVLAYAGRLKSHLAHCPGSNLAATAANWEKTRTDYSKRFAQRHCRKTLPQ